MRLFRDFRDLLSSLNASKVKYLIVGGYAVGMHAQPRVTKDLDILVKRDAANARALLRALEDFGAPVSSITAADLVEEGKFFRFGRPPVAVDILSEIAGVTFAQAWKRRVTVSIEEEDDLKVHVICGDDLIAAKRASARPQDLADIDAIQTARTAHAKPSTTRKAKGRPKTKGRKSKQ